jgi:hypothetical protein
MGFFDDKFNGEKAPTNGEYSGPTIEIIPKGTQCLAYIEDAELEHSREGDEQYVSLKWRVSKPTEIANRVLFQKLKIWDKDQKKRTRAFMMLAAIDANAGGVIAGQSKDPDDALLSRALLNKPMLIKLDVWEIDGKQGNWICAVAPRPTGELPPMPAPTSKLTDDEIPF